MILNMSAETAGVLLAIVDGLARGYLSEVKSARGDERAELIYTIKHLGILKHRLEYGLGLPNPFVGPSAWGFPLKEQ